MTVSRSAFLNRGLQRTRPFLPRFARAQISRVRSIACLSFYGRDSGLLFAQFAHRHGSLEGNIIGQSPFKLAALM